jgi:hypothetical protein
MGSAARMWRPAFRRRRKPGMRGLIEEASRSRTTKWEAKIVFARCVLAALFLLLWPRRFTAFCRYAFARTQRINHEVTPTDSILRG